MSAVVFSEYGGPEVLSIAQRPVPAPGRTEVLVRISSAAVSTADVIMRKGSPFVARLAMGLLKPGKPVWVKRKRVKGRIVPGHWR